MVQQKERNTEARGSDEFDARKKPGAPIKCIGVQKTHKQRPYEPKFPNPTASNRKDGTRAAEKMALGMELIPSPALGILQTIDGTARGESSELRAHRLMGHGFARGGATAASIGAALQLVVSAHFFAGIRAGLADFGTNIALPG